LKKILVVSTLGAALLVAAAASAGPAKANHKSVAEKIVSQVVNVKEGDVVSVAGDVRDFDLLEEISLAAEKRGAFALQTVGKESNGLRFVKEVPEKYDAREPKLQLELAKIVDVQIGVWGQEMPGQYKDIPASRMTARAKANQTLEKARMDNGVRQVAIGNGLYPTDATAKQYGLTKAQLEKIFWDGLDVDYTRLQADAEAVRAALASGKEVRVTNSNGTDLKFRIEARQVFVSDGVISDEDVKRGGAALQVWLPAGEVYVTPVPGTAEGKLVFDRVPYADGVIEGLTFEVKAGKFTGFTAKASKPFDRLKEVYAAATGAKDELSIFDIGVNRAVKVPAGSKLTSWVPAGSVSLGFGGNIWAGGTNDATGDIISSMNGSTVVVDGKTIVEKGELKVSTSGG